jgi:hypothetical protein
MSSDRIRAIIILIASLALLAPVLGCNSSSDDPVVAEQDIDQDGSKDGDNDDGGGEAVTVLTADMADYRAPGTEKTFVYTVGGPDEDPYLFASIEEEDVVVPYVSGDLTGHTWYFRAGSPAGNVIRLHTWGFDGTSLMLLESGFLNNSGQLITYYHSTDQILTAHPDGYKYGIVSDWQVLDNTGTYYVRTDGSGSIENNTRAFIRIQDVISNQGVLYEDAVITYNCNTTKTYQPITGVPDQYGLDLPASDDTEGFAVVSLGVWGKGKGSVIFFTVNPDTGAVTEAFEQVENTN